MKRISIGIIGAGPMAIFLIKHLIRQKARLQITVFEQQRLAGMGIPYRADIGPDYMLANIFSRDIPLIHDPLADWLRAQPNGWLDRWGVSPNAISDRAFYPRTLIGAYLASQLRALVAVATAAGHEVSVRTTHNVVDVRPIADAIQVVANTADRLISTVFDKVVLATGHTSETARRKARHRWYRHGPQAISRHCLLPRSAFWDPLCQRWMLRPHSAMTTGRLPKHAIA